MLDSKSQAQLSLQTKARLYPAEMTFKDRLKQARKASSPKVTQDTLANAVGVTKQAVSGWERGESMPEPDKLVKISNYLGVTTGWLLGNEQGEAGAPQIIRPSGPEQSTVEDAPNAPRLSQLGDFDVEVRGITVGGSDDEFYFNGDVIDHVRRPPGIRHARNVFALNVSGDSMMPRYEPGEPIYVQRAHAVPGDYVVVELYPENDDQAGKSFVKQLVRRTGLRITCRQLNPEREIEFDAGEVKEIYRVLKPKELLG